MPRSNLKVIHDQNFMNKRKSKKELALIEHIGMGVEELNK